MPTPEVWIVGSGPAALAAALRLATLGRRVTLVVAERSRGAGALETLQSRDVLSFAFPGCGEGPDSGLERLSGGISWWSGEEAELPAGFIVDRPVFDRVVLDRALLHQAAGRGIEVSTAPMAPSPGQRWIDATGRGSPWREAEPLVPWRQSALVALSQESEDLPAMWLESLPHGWLWGLRGGADRRYALSLFLDAEDLATGAGTAEVWKRHLQGSRLWPQLERRKFSAPLPREVTPVAARVSGGLDPMSIGDAALARDPLAAQGFTAGLSDGLAAAAACHTLLLDPEREELVREFLADRQDRARAEHLRALEKAYGAAPFDTPYWRRRREIEAPPEDPPPPLPNIPLAEIRWAQSPRWQFRTAPILFDDRIVRGECLCHEAGQDKLAWLEGRPLRDFLAATEPPAKSRDIVDRWVASGLAGETKGLHALRWLVERAILIPET